MTGSKSENQTRRGGIRTEFRNPPSEMNFANFREDVNARIGDYARSAERPYKIEVEITITELDADDE